mgnify:CR=1 FL=1
MLHDDYEAVLFAKHAKYKHRATSVLVHDAADQRCSMI